MSNSMMDELPQTSLPLLEQGLDLMLYGMGIVFVFLAVLVTAITVVSFIIHKFWPNNVEMEILSGQNVTPIEVKDSDRLLKILQNAIDQHRDRY